MRAGGVPLFSVDTHRAAGDFDVLAFNLVGRARLHERARTASTSPASRCGPSDRRPEHPLVVVGGHCAFNPEPHGRLRRRVRDRRRRGAGRRDHRGRRRRGSAPGAPPARACCASSPRSPASTCRRCTTSSTTARSSPRSRRASPTCPSASTSAPSPTSPTGRTRSSQLVPLIEVVHDRLNVEIFRGCTRGCRFCQAGMITRPVRERPADQVRTMVRGRPAPHRLRRGRAHVAVERRLLGDRRPRRRPRQRAGGLRQRRRSRCRRCGSTRSPSASPARSRRCAAPGSRSRPRAARGGSAR